MTNKHVTFFQVFTRTPRLPKKNALPEEIMISKMEEATAVEDHIGHLKVILGSLGTLGVRVSNEQYILTPLRSLLPNYESVVIAVEKMVESLKTSEFFSPFSSLYM